jgi:tetratricopeptide (TPR) repeat protein
MLPGRRFVLFFALVLAPLQARAQSDDALARARTHFEAGRALYDLGSYSEAAREFAAGYRLAPRPQFLLNLGQCYRRLDQLDNAREMYRRFLADAPPDDRDRAQAAEVLAEIERQIAERPAPEPSPPSPSAAHAEATPSPHAAALTLTAAPPTKKPFIKRHWWIIPVSVAVAGAGVALGVYYGTRSDGCAGGNLGCWDLKK